MPTRKDKKAPRQPARKREPSKRAEDVVRRHTLVIAERSSGASWSTVCEKSKLSIGQAKAVWKAFVDDGKLTIQSEDPVAVVFEQITRLDQMIEELSAIGRDESAQHTARVGAIRSKGVLIAQQTELLQAVGLMPRNLGRIQVEIEQRYVFQQLSVFLDKFVPEEQVEQAEDFLTTLFQRARPELAAVV